MNGNRTISNLDPATANPARAADARPLTAIVVDDEKFDRMSARRRLMRSGRFEEVLEIDDGDAFLDCVFGRDAPILARAASPVLVLIDINMRRMDGFHTIAELQARIEAGEGRGDLVVFMLTSSINGGDQVRAAQLPLVAGYLTKPISDDDVRHLLARCDA